MEYNHDHSTAESSHARRYLQSEKTKKQWSSEKISKMFILNQFFLAVMYAKGGNHSHKVHRNAKMYKKKKRKGGEKCIMSGNMW